MPDLRKGYWVHLLPCERCDGSLAIAFLARRSYKIAVDNAILEPLPDEEQPPFLEQDRCDEGKPDKAPPTLELELVPEKARADVLVLGKALAPGGKPLPEFEVAIRVGNRQQRLKILGPRKAIWVPPQKREGKLVPQPPKFTAPTPIKELPLSYLHAYGGPTWVVPDDETLALKAKVEEALAPERKEAEAKKAAVKQAQEQSEAQKKKEEAEKALFDDLGKKGPKEEKLKRGYGQEGFDEEGVRLWNAAAAKDGTAVLDLDELDAMKLADMAREERERQEEEERKAREPKPEARRKMRQNAAGEWIEIDEGVEILTEEQLAAERAQAEAEAQADRQALAQASHKRTREQVEANDGTRVLELDAIPSEDQDTWEKDLKASLVDGDSVEEVARQKRIAERKKEEEAALKDFPKLPCPTNPYGKGFCVSNHQAVLSRLELPQIEDPAAPLTPDDLIQDLTALDKVPLPAGFSTYPRQARPRVDLMGPPRSALKDWPAQLEAQKRALDLSKEDDVRLLRELERRGPPEACKPGFYNAAAPTMQWGELVGDEEVVLTNLTKDGTLFFKLPGKVLEAELDRGRGIERKDLKLDTLVVEVETRTVTLLWRAHYPMASWDELGDYPQMVGWVLDLDVQARKDRDWADRLKKSQGDGTMVLDLNELPLEAEPYLPAQPKVEVPVEGTAALDLDKMGTYRQIVEDDWVKQASDGMVDVTAEEKKKKEEAEYVAKKLAALKALEEQEKKDKERLEEVAAAIQAGKPVPPAGGPNAAKKVKAKA